MASLITFREIGARHRAEGAVQTLSTAVEQAADSIFITDRQGVTEYVNPAFERLTGYASAEILGRRPSFLQGGGHDGAFYGRLWQTILSGRTFRAVFRDRKKDGRLFHLDETITPLADPDGTITHFVSVGRDMTDRIRIEQQLQASHEQLRDLAAHLESVREEERTRIAREIHDELGQMLTGLKIDLCWVAPKIAAAGLPLQQKLDAMSGLVDMALDSVGRIATELRPAALDSLGLPPAMEGLARDFQERTGIRCTVTSQPAEDEAIEPALATTLFRICQEALTNVARHAGARNVRLDLTREAMGLLLTVEDDGKGIREEQVWAKESLGLLGMRERALMHGGKVFVSGAPGKGTTVTVAMPLRQPPEGEHGWDDPDSHRG
jgi:PAS domain S-box-containing protein